MKRLSATSGALLVINSMFGIGIIMIPKAFADLGILGSITTLIATTFLTFASLLMLTYTAESTSCFSYARMCSRVGAPLEFMLDAAVALNGYCSTLCYIICVCDYFVDLLPTDIFGEQIYKAIVAAFILCSLFFLGIQRSLDKLKVLSWFTLASTVFVSVKLLFYACFSNFKSSAEAVPFILGKKPVDGISPLILAMVCQQSAVEIYAQLSRRGMEGSIKAMGLGSLLGGGICMMIGYFGSKLFGDFPELNFLQIYTNKNSEFMKYVKESTFDKFAIVPRLCVFCFIIVLVFAFPIQTLASRSSLFNIILRKKQATKKAVILVTALQSAIIFGLVAAGVKPNTVINFVGITASPMIAFMFPSIILMNFVGTRKKLLFSVSALICIMSCLLMIYGLYDFFAKHIFTI